MSSSPLKRLLSYSGYYRRQVILASICSFLNKLFDIAPEILIGVAVDVAVRRQDSVLAQLGIADPFTQILVLAFLTFLIWACESLFEFLYSILWRNLAQRVQHDLRIDAYRHVQNLSLSYFENRSTGGLVSILNDDINQLERFLDGGANTIIQVGSAVVLVSAVFFYLAPVVAALALMPIPVILLGAFYFQRKAEPLYAKVRDQAGALAGRLSNNLSGIATIKSYVTEEQELTRLARESNDYVQANAGAIRLGSAFNPLIRMAVLTGFLATLIYGGKLTIDGVLEVGSYSVLVFLTQRLLWPLTSLAQTADLYQRAMASTRRVLDLLEAPQTDRRPGQRLDRNGVKGELTFARVRFAYEGRETVLHDVSFTIPAGTTAAFIGTTGSGKSTIAKLLLRFYEATQGDILLDGRSIGDYEVDDLRRVIGFVSQDVFLLDGTVAENIAYGTQGATPAQIRDAAKLAEAEDFILSLPQSYDTRVGERGQKLSGGQRQRISLARAILKNAPILILDEATSAVDNETELAIQRSLEKIGHSRTMIIIAHRLTTIRNADQVFLVENGHVVPTDNPVVRRAPQPA